MVQRFRVPRCIVEKVSIHDSNARLMPGGALLWICRLIVVGSSGDLWFASGPATRMPCESRFETRRGLYNG